MQKIIAIFHLEARRWNQKTVIDRNRQGSKYGFGLRQSFHDDHHFAELVGSRRGSGRSQRPPEALSTSAGTAKSTTKTYLVSMIEYRWIDPHRHQAGNWWNL